MSSCDILLQQIKNIKEVILPFHYELLGSEKYTQNLHEQPIEFSSVDFPALRSANYTPYQLKCFLTKLSSDLNRNYPGEWYLDTIPKRLADKMVLCLQIYVNGKYHSPEDKELILINKLVKKYSTYYTDYVSILDDSADITYKDMVIQKYFVAQILPYVQLPNYDYLYEEGKLMVRFYISTYTRSINELYTWLLDLFMSLYQKGTILLDLSEEDELFAQKWLLRPLYETSLYNSDLQPYIPTWDNRLLSSQMTEFIERCYCLREKSYIALPVTDETKKTSISSQLDKIGLKHQYMENMVLVNTSSYFEAEAALEIIIGD